jgi:hypothetical protein
MKPGTIALVIRTVVIERQHFFNREHREVIIGRWKAVWRGKKRITVIIAPHIRDERRRMVLLEDKNPNKVNWNKLRGIKAPEIISLPITRPPAIYSNKQRE